MVTPPRAAKGLASFRKHACSRAKVGTAPIQRKAGSCCTLNQECNRRSSNQLVLNYSNHSCRARLHPSIHPQYNDFLFFLNSRCNLHHCTLVGNLTRIAQTLATIWWIHVCHLSRSSFLAPWAINFSDPFARHINPSLTEECPIQDAKGFQQPSEDDLRSDLCG